MLRGSKHSFNAAFELSQASAAVDKGKTLCVNSTSPIDSQFVPRTNVKVEIYLAKEEEDKEESTH